LQRKLEYPCRPLLQTLLDRGVHYYSGACLQRTAGFQEFRESLGDVGPWKAAMLWNEAHPTESITVRKFGSADDNLCILLLISIAKFHRAGFLDDSAARRLAPELLQALTGYYRLVPRLKEFTSIKDGFHELFNSIAYMREALPPLPDDHPKLDVHGAIDACKEVLYSRVLHRMHQLPSVRTVWLMRSAVTLELPNDKLTEELNLCLIGPHYRKLKFKARGFVAALVACKVRLSEGAQEKLCEVVTEHLSEAHGSGNLPTGLAYPFLLDYATMVTRVPVETVDAALEAEGRSVSVAVDWEGRWGEMAQELGVGGGSQEDAQAAVLQILRDWKGTGDVGGAVDAMRPVTDAAL
jgi:hypothetical protein